MIAVTIEIYTEMHGSIRGLVGNCIDHNKANMLREIGDETWDYSVYALVAAAMQIRQHDFISEYTGGSKKTVGLADISIIALAKALNVPMVSMEKPVRAGVIGKRKIPDVCRDEGVEHLDFNEFLRRERIGF